MKARWILLIAVILSVICVCFFVAHKQRPKTADYEPLVGQWVRPDGGYVLDVKSIDSDGKIEMAYLNPRQINVSKAQANTKKGKIELLIELRDKGYPGNFYTLTFDPENKQLFGMYHHLGLNQNFDVYFVRR